MRSYVVTKAEALRIGEAQFLLYFLEDAEPGWKRVCSSGLIFFMP
jgi:hypothetical protein